jgi:hypothetical protein
MLATASEQLRYQKTGLEPGSCFDRWQWRISLSSWDHRLVPWSWLLDFMSKRVASSLSWDLTWSASPQCLTWLLIPGEDNAIMSTIRTAISRQNHHSSDNACSLAEPLRLRDHLNLFFYFAITIDQPYLISDKKALLHSLASMESKRWNTNRILAIKAIGRMCVTNTWYP